MKAALTEGRRINGVLQAGDGLLRLNYHLPILTLDHSDRKAIRRLLEGLFGRSMTKRTPVSTTMNHE
jgi:hypothetical protein